jgi:MoxR-like ATPase
VAQLIRLSHRVFVADSLYIYAVRLATATREHKQVRVGVSPRGVIALTRAAQAYALTDGRAYVIPEDIKQLIEPVFAHRLLLAPDAAMRGVTPTEILKTVVESVSAPSPAASRA